MALDTLDCQIGEEIAGKYDLSLAAVFSVMAYYFDHRDEVDRRIQEDQAFVEAFRRAKPSPYAGEAASIGPCLSRSGFISTSNSPQTSRVLCGSTKHCLLP